MRAAELAGHVSALAARQWGLLTTAQADAGGVSRLQLSRLANSGALERVQRGIYVVPAAVDERTPLRAAWLSLDPSTMAEDRLITPTDCGVVSHTSAAALYGVGDLPDDVPEITVTGRKQSRRDIRLHRAALSSDDVTIVDGLPVTTLPRTIADLLRDGHDPSHVAEITGDALRGNHASRQEMADALDPLAGSMGQPSGTALLEYLLDIVGLSSAALATEFVNGELGKVLITAGQASAINTIIGAVPQLTLPADTIESMNAKVAETLARLLPRIELPEDLQPKIDMSSLIGNIDMRSLVDPKILENAPHTDIVRKLAQAFRGKIRGPEASHAPSGAADPEFDEVRS